MEHIGKYIIHHAIHVKWDMKWAGIRRLVDLVFGKFVVFAVHISKS